MFKDPESGISYGINYEACRSESQRKAVESFVKGLHESLNKDFNLHNPQYMEDTYKNKPVKDPLTGEFIPEASFEEMCELVENYKEFKEFLDEMIKLDNELKYNCKCLTYKTAIKKHRHLFSIRKNFEHYRIYKYRDIGNMVDVAEFQVGREK